MSDAKKWLLATAIAPYTAPDHGYLTFSKWDWVLKLYIGLEDIDEEGWIYAQSVDRADDVGWAPAEFFIDVPTQYHPDKLASTAADIERSQVFAIIRHLSRTEEQLRIAQTRAEEAEQYAMNLDSENQRLQSLFH